LLVVYVPPAPVATQKLGYSHETDSRSAVVPDAGDVQVVPPSIDKRTMPPAPTATQPRGAQFTPYRVGELIEPVVNTDHVTPPFTVLTIVLPDPTA
jgi:hypothetical protein